MALFHHKSQLQYGAQVVQKPTTYPVMVDSLASGAVIHSPIHFFLDQLFQSNQSKVLSVI
jgi:hypothetical protein